MQWSNIWPHGSTLYTFITIIWLEYGREVLTQDGNLVNVWLNLSPCSVVVWGSVCVLLVGVIGSVIHYPQGLNEGETNIDGRIYKTLWSKEMLGVCTRCVIHLYCVLLQFSAGSLSLFNNTAHTIFCTLLPMHMLLNLIDTKYLQFSLFVSVQQHFSPLLNTNTVCFEILANPVKIKFVKKLVVIHFYEFSFV